jgi:hypothetical protein
MTNTMSCDGHDQKTFEMARNNFKNLWAQKTTKQVQKEVKSWRSYMQRYTQAYAWHGAGMTAPGQLADGDKLCILREILSERNAEELA